MRNYYNNQIEQLYNYNIDIRNREIYLHSSTYTEEENGVDFRSAISLQKNIRFLNTLSYDPIIIHMHIPGGEWSDCLSIYDTISQCESPIAILVYSRAESSGSIILQAADLRIMMPNAYTLIHYGSTYVDGDHKVAVSNMQWSQEQANKMIDIFTDKMLESPMIQEKKWKKPMIKKHIISQLDNKSDWILYAEETIYYGFADGILGSDNFASIEDIRTYLKKNY